MKRTSLALLAALAGCASLQGPVPKGFAAYPADSDRLEAISPDEVGWRLRILKDQPEASLAFWKAAVRQHLESQGHLVVDSLETKWNGRPAAGYETRRTISGAESAYLVVVSPDGERIAIAEAQGPVESFQRRRAALRAALDSLQSK